MRERRIAAHPPQRRLGIVDRIGVIDVALAAAARLAIGVPHGAHEVVERHAPSAALPKREVQRQRDRRAVGIVRDVGVRPVRPVVRPAAVDERRHPAHLLRRPHVAPGSVHHRVDVALEGSRRVVQRREARALQRERTVVLGEALRQPQRIGHVHAIQIEGLETLRADAFDVPVVEELVRHRVEQGIRGARQRRGRRHHRAVAVLHPVAIRPGQVVGDEGVAARFVVGELAEDLLLLLDDPLDLLDERVELGVGAQVVHGEPEDVAVDRELAHRDRAELDGAVHEVLQVRRRVLEGRRAWMQLRRDPPLLPPRRLERQHGRAVVQAARPHDGRGHVQVKVGAVDRQVGAVHRVAVDPVAHGRRAAVPGGHPAGGVGPRQRELRPVAAGHVHVVDVLREIVERVAPGRRPAHVQIERRAAEIRKRRFDLHPVVLRLGNGEPVPDRLGRRGRRGEDRQGGQRRNRRARADDDGPADPHVRRRPRRAPARRTRPRAARRGSRSRRRPPSSERRSPCTCRARSGNSVASTANDVICGLANAISLARLTARGQYGQLGVVKTRMVRGASTAARRARLASDRCDAPPPARRIASTSDTNS